MFHLGVYSAAIASATADQQVAALADPLLAPAGTGYLVHSQYNKIMRAAAVGNILMRAKLVSGSLRDVAPFDIAPPNVGTIIGSPARRLDFLDNPLPLKPNEELDAFVTNSAATSTVTSVALWLSDGPRRKVQGRFFSMHWTVTKTLVAGAFTAFTPVLDNGLPAGVFAVVGSRAKSVSGLFHRYIPRNSASVRPGSFMTQGDGDFATMDDRFGELGEWFRFENTGLPQIEILALAADTVAEGFIDLQQVG